MSKKLTEALNYLIYAHGLTASASEKNGLIAIETESDENPYIKTLSEGYDAHPVSDALTLDLVKLGMIKPKPGREKEFTAIQNEAVDGHLLTEFARTNARSWARRLASESANLTVASQSLFSTSSTGDVMKVHFNGQDETTALAGLTQRAEEVIGEKKEQFLQATGQKAGFIQKEAFRKQATAKKSFP